jgi:subtilisin family serine protease
MLVMLATAGWFYPNATNAVAVFEGGEVGGMPVALSGGIAVRADDPAALAREPGVASVEVLRGQVARVVVATGVDEIALSRRLRDRADVAWAHPDFIVFPVLTSEPNDPYFADQWHLDNTGQSGWTPGTDINAVAAWDMATGAGQLVAVIDTGIELTHPDLSVIGGYDYIDDDDDPTPIPGVGSSPGHGTSAAGLAAAIGDNDLGVTGVAYDADLWGARILGGDASMTDFYDAFMDAMDAGATVLSNSYRFGDDCPNVPLYSVFEDAFETLEAEGRGGLGTAFVFSTGNSNCDASNDEIQAYPTVTSVTAIDGHGKRESYSSWGDVVDITAPSGGVLTTDLTGPDWGYGKWQEDSDYTPTFSGTSASCPIVAGVLALMFSANDRLTAAEAREVLCDTATRNDIEFAAYDDAGWSTYYGCGLVDAAAAVAAVANVRPDQPTLITPTDRTWEGTALLQWEGGDADGDQLTWRVDWHRGAEENTEIVDEPWLDLSDELLAGDEVRWQVRAIDRWGAGDTSEAATFIVDAIPEPPEPDPEPEQGGCGCSTSTTAPWLLLWMLPIVIRRRSGR